MAKISELASTSNLSGRERVVLVQGGETKQADAGGLVATLAAPSISRAEEARDMAEAAALAALVAMGDGLYDSIAEGLTVTEPGEGFYVRDEGGGLALYINEGATARRAIVFATRASLRGNGINLWEEAKGDGSTDPADMAATTEAIKSVMEDAGRWGIGLVNCGGRDKVYVCGGEYASFGDFTIIGKDSTRTVPFRRGRIPMVSNVELRGASPVSRAKFLAAPGDRDPGGLFYTPFWLDQDGQRENVAFRWIELDGNADNQTLTQYAGGGSDTGMWIQGHAIASGSMTNLLVYECQIHGWRGHAVFGFYQSYANDVEANDWKMIGNDIFDNMQGGAQIDMARFYSERNWYHGNGGWTALGPNLEMGGEEGRILDVWSVNDLFDGRDGRSCVEATVRPWGGHAGLDTDSPEAQAARVRYRRGLFLSGNYYTTPTDNLFKRQRGRIHIVNPKCWQASIGGGGFDRIHLLNPQIEIDFEDMSRIWPPVGEPINFGSTAGGYDVKGFDQLVIRDAMLNADTDGPGIKIGGFKKINVTAQITGGRNAGVRLEQVGGKIDVQVEDCGTKTDRAYWQTLFPGTSDKDADALIGSTSAAVVAFGARGPLEIHANAVDSRAPADRKMEYAVYANVSTEFPVKVDGVSAGTTIGGTKDVNASLADDRLTTAEDRTKRIRGPVEISNGLKVEGAVAFVSNDGDLDVTLRAPLGSNTKLSFVKGIGLEAQLVQLANGDMQVNIFENGVATGTPIVFANDARVRMSATWQRPFEIQNGTFLWVDAAGALRIGGGRPIADDSGIVVGTQV
jgi:hypothetical protein